MHYLTYNNNDNQGNIFKVLNSFGQEFKKLPKGHMI